MQTSRMVYAEQALTSSRIEVDGTERRRRHRSLKRRLPDFGCDPNSGGKCDIDLWLWLKLVKNWAKFPLQRMDMKLLKKMDTELH